MTAIEGREVDSFCLWSFDGRSLHLFMSSVLGMRKVVGWLGGMHLAEGIGNVVEVGGKCTDL